MRVVIRGVGLGIVLVTGAAYTLCGVSETMRYSLQALSYYD